MLTETIPCDAPPPIDRGADDYDLAAFLAVQSDGWTSAIRIAGLLAVGVEDEGEREIR